MDLLYISLSIFRTTIGIGYFAIKGMLNQLNTRKKRKLAVLVTTACFLVCFMVLQQEDTDTIVKRRLNTLYAKYNLSVDDFDKWNYSSSDHLFDNSVLRPVAKNYTQEHVVAMNAPRNSINFHFQPVKPDVKNSVKDVLTNKTKGIRLGENDIKDLQLVGQENDDKQKTEDKDIDTEDKSSPELTKEELEEAAEQFQAMVPPVEESEEEEETEEDTEPVKKVKTVAKKPGKKEAKVPKKVVAPKKSTKTKKVVAPKKPSTKRKEIVPPKNATKKVVAKKKTAPVKKVVVPKKADAKKTKKTVKAKVPAEDPKKPKVAPKKVETPKKKVAKPSLKDKVKAKKKTKTSVKRKVTDKQGREMEEELYKLAPEVFDFVPREFEADVSSPCWVDDDEDTWCLPYFYVIGMPDSGSENLWQKIQQHPAVAETSMSGYHWWNRRRAREKDILLESFQSYLELGETVIAEFEDNNFEMIYGDHSTSLFWDNGWWNQYYPGFQEAPSLTTADILATVYPKAKLLVIVTEPATSIYLNYLILKGEEATPDDFDERVANSIDIFEECVQNKSPRTCLYEPYNPQDNTIHLNWGLFYQYFEDWLKAFPLTQFHIIEKNNFEKNCLVDLPKIYSFLNLERLSMRKIREICQSKSTLFRVAPADSEPIDKGTKNLLESFYAPYFDKLDEVLQKH